MLDSLAVWHLTSAATVSPQDCCTSPLFKSLHDTLQFGQVSRQYSVNIASFLWMKQPNSYMHDVKVKLNYYNGSSCTLVKKYAEACKGMCWMYLHFEQTNNNKATAVEASWEKYHRLSPSCFLTGQTRIYCPLTCSQSFCLSPNT